MVIVTDDRHVKIPGIARDLGCPGPQVHTDARGRSDGFHQRG